MVMIFQTFLLFALISCYSINHPRSRVTCTVDQSADAASNFCFGADGVSDPELSEIRENDNLEYTIFGSPWFNDTVEAKHTNLFSAETQKCALNFLSMRLLL